MERKSDDEPFPDQSGEFSIPVHGVPVGKGVEIRGPFADQHNGFPCPCYGSIDLFPDSIYRIGTVQHDDGSPGLSALRLMNGDSISKRQEPCLASRIGHTPSVIRKEHACVFFPDYGRSVTYTRRQARFLTLAYAVTIHKAQGAETGAAVIVLDGSNSVNAVRKQIYTAVTRARKAVVLIGERSAYLDALSDRNAVNRNTELTGLIRERFII